MKTQILMREKGIDHFSKKYKLKTQRHEKYSNLVLLKYDLIKSTMSSPYVQECRGIIFDEKEDYKIVCYPFNKFFNLNETSQKINFKKAKVYDKIDGSLCTLYYYNDEWIVSSTGTPDGSGLLNKIGITFGELFWNIWNKLKYQFPKDKNLCYMFEMISTKNIIIVPPKEDDIILIGARNLKTMKEEFPEELAKMNGWKCVNSDTFENMNKVFDASYSLDPSISEGFVVTDDEFNRVKVKSKKYVALAHLKNGNQMNQRHMLEIIRINEQDEFLTYYKEYTDLYNLVKKKYDIFINKKEELYKKVVGDGNFKDNLTKYDCDLDEIKMFKEMKKEGMISVKEYYAKCRIKVIEEEFINVKLEEEKIFWKEQKEKEKDEKKRKKK